MDDETQSDFRKVTPPSRSATVRKWVGLLMMVVLILSLATWLISRDRLPGTIRIATAEPDGQYYQFGTALQLALQQRTGRQVEVLETGGSVENAKLLAQGEVELAIVQSGSVSLNELAVVAPIYRDVVHFIARNDSDVQSVRDLRGRRVALGANGSGHRESARQILEHYGLNESDLEETTNNFRDLGDQQSEFAAAIVTTGMKNPALDKLLNSGDFQIIPLHAKALSTEYSHFDEVEIPRGYYREGPSVPATDIETVAATATVVVRADGSAKLIRRTLEAIYESDINDKFPNLISPDQALDVVPRRMHPVSQIFYDPFDRVGWTATLFEAMAGAKELLFAIGAGLYLLWDRWRRLNERENQEAMNKQKQHLDRFLAETLRVERAQMGESDPDKLNGYLDQITIIKLRALEELTHEDLRGDRAFSIFLIQCANLINKIQLKIFTEATRQDSSSTEQ